MTDARWSLVAAHRERLIALARRRCPTFEDAEDVVQEALLRAATHADLDESRLGQFLTTVTVHLCADLYRTADRANRAVRRLAPQLQDTPSPEERACSDAAAYTLAGMVDALPERQRAVLVDRAHGLSVTQIGVRHALSYKAAESALARARGAIRLAIASSLAALVAAFRPRRIALVAVPASALLLFVTAVHHWPAGTHRPGTHAGSASTERLVGDAPAAQSVALREGRLRAHPLALRARPAPAGRGRPSPWHTYADVGAGPSKTRVTGYDETPQELAERCLREGVYVEVDRDALPVRGGDGCGRPPRHDHGTIVVYVSTTPFAPTRGNPG